MKIIVAPDSFKGCLRSHEVCAAIEAGIKRAAPGAEVVCVPMADGGEGTVDVVSRATGGKMEKVMVEGPLGSPTTAEFCLINNGATAVMEMASASGIELVPADKLNPMAASTYGTGQMMRAALDMGVREIIIGIGGSATVDGGAGMAQALGLRLLDGSGAEVPRGGGPLADVRSADASGMDPRLRETSVRVACDVTNPLLGKNGAAFVFGPQKGATPDMVGVLDSNLANYAKVLKAAGLADAPDKPGDGAAGGLGFSLRNLCRAKMVSGARLVIEITGLERHLDGADLLITGEGRTDSQTASGKICSVIAETAARHGVPTVLLSGAVALGASESLGPFAFAASVCRGPSTLAEALRDAPGNLEFAGRNIASLLLGLGKK